MNYYPILKLRSSEIQSINEVKKKFTPIIELDNNATAKTLEYLKDVKQDYYFDLKNKNDLLELAKTKKFSPVLGIDRDYYYNAFCMEIAKTNNKALIRVKLKDFNKINEITSLIKAVSLHLPKENVKILLDLETIHGDLDTLYEKIVETLPKFSNIILAGNSVPNTTSGIAKNSHKEIDRKEWQLYQAIKESGFNIEFADYGIRHHESIGNDNIDYAPKVDVKLIYTTEEGFLVFRGEGFNHGLQKGSKSIVPICKQISQIEGFDKDYSYGDTKIYEIATQDHSKAGNPGEWIKIGHTHHISLLCDLLASN